MVVFTVCKVSQGFRKRISEVITRQIFLLARDWSKCAVWLSMPHQKLRNTEVILRIPNLWEPTYCKKSFWRTTNTNRFNFENMFQEVNGFPRAKTVNSEEQIILQDKYLSIFCAKWRLYFNTNKVKISGTVSWEKIFWTGNRRFKSLWTYHVLNYLSNNFKLFSQSLSSTVDA